MSCISRGRPWFQLFDTVCSQCLMVGQSLKKINFQDCPLGICTYDVGLEEFVQVSQSNTCGDFIFLSFLYPPCYIDSVKGRINYPD